MTRSLFLSARQARELGLTDKAPPKYGNEKTELDGFTFDSQAEARRYGELRYREQAGEIRNLRVHTRWELLVEGPFGEVPLHYTSDFDYEEAPDWRLVVEDVKSRPTVTEAYRIRKKLMKALRGIEIQEVRN